MEKVNNYNNKDNFDDSIHQAMQINISEAFGTYNTDKNAVDSINNEVVDVLYKEFDVNGDLSITDLTKDGIHKDLVQKYSDNRKYTQSLIKIIWKQIEDELTNKKSDSIDNSKTIDLVRHLKHVEDSCVNNNSISKIIANNDDLVFFDPNEDFSVTTDTKEDYCKLEQQILWRRIVELLNYNVEMKLDKNKFSSPMDKRGMEVYNNDLIITYLQGILNLKRINSKIECQDETLYNIKELNR